MILVGKLVLFIGLTSLSSCLKVDNSFENDESDFMPKAAASSNLAAVQTIFKKYTCQECHVTKNIQPSPTKFLTWDDSQWKQGYVTPGKPTESLIFNRLRWSGCSSGTCNMPDETSALIGDDEIAAIKKWIEEMP